MIRFCYIAIFFSDTTQNFTDHLLEFLTQQRNEADVKAKEEEMRKKNELEKERQKLRESYVREWDLGKDGVEDKAKKFREMTQEEYVEQQRDIRNDEFAPLKASNSKSNHSFDNQGKMVPSAESKTWSDVRPEATFPPSDIGDLTEQKGLYFSSKKQNEPGPSHVETIPVAPPPTSNIRYKEVKYKNFVRPQEPTPIVNELIDDDESNIDKINHKQNSNNSSGLEVAPPPTYDYYGPVPKKQKFVKPFESDIREAYAQGAKSLEVKTKSRQISKDYDFMFH